MRNLLLSAILGIVGGFVSNLLLQHWGELQARKRFSVLGISIIDSLLAQLNIGLGILEELAKAKTSGMLLPNSAWSGMKTIPEGVLLGIVSMDAVKPRHHQSDLYLPSSLIVHCDNYSTYICENTNNLIRNWVPSNPHQIVVSPGAIQSSAAKQLPNVGKVQSLLEDTKKLLKANSSKWCPK